MLAPYATNPENSKGRKVKEKEHKYRTIYQRDRDRIVHSSAFRKLEYKTQVFIFREGDYRKRLTHTIEVSQIARTISRALDLNEDLTEAIALAHDLGHTPFGHAGEDVLNNILKDQGGFNHNLQSLKVVDFLEKRYPDFDGLNLTWEVREGIAKHSTRYDNIGVLEKLPELLPQEQPSLETQIVDIADEIAYDNHDLDDALRNNLLQEKDLDKLCLWADVKKNILKNYAHIKPNILNMLIIRDIINLQVTDIIKTTQKNIKKYKICSYQKVKKMPIRIARFSKKLQSIRQPLRDFLKNDLYCHWKVLRMTGKAKRLLKSLFDVYLENPQQLPPEFKSRIRGEGTIKEVIADYIAAMTDRQAQDEYKKFFDPFEKI